jgi:putative transcriptional regulator
MIKCHLSRLMGERRLRVMDVARETGLHRGMITLLYNDTASRVEIDALARLCAFFECDVGDLLEFVPERSKASKSGAKQSSKGA